MRFATEYADFNEVAQVLKDELVPAISEHIRLFKTPKQRQDEYIVIDAAWLGDDVFQTYGIERDMVDRLYSAGIPALIFFDLVAGNRVIQQKVNTFKAWRRSTETQADRLIGLCYQPGMPSVVGNKFNTYRDVSVQPLEGVELSEMLDHLHDNLCNGNTEYYTYLMKYLAHMVQRPNERPMTGIAIIGGQGTGKGIFIEFLKRMMGGSRNVNTTASADDTKSFNFSLGNKLLVVFDEATFSGDRKQADFMKKLVTEPRIRIEQKGLDAYEVDNFARVIITSNNMQSAVPASIGARRWLIIECQNDLSQEQLAEFAQTMAERQYAQGFKHYLLNYDITGFDTTKLPQQNTGFQTKLHNHYKEDPIYAFLCEWLSAPALIMFRMMKGDGADPSAEFDERLTWDQEVLFSTFYAVFKESCTSSYGNPPGPNRMRDLLAPYGITIRPGTGNVRYVHPPEARDVLRTLERSARFDLLVTEEQRAYIGTHHMYPTLAERSKDPAFKIWESEEQHQEYLKRMLQPDQDGTRSTLVISPSMMVSNPPKDSEKWFEPEPVTDEQPWFIDAPDWATKLPENDNPFGFDI